RSLCRTANRHAATEDRREHSNHHLHVAPFRRSRRLDMINDGRASDVGKRRARATRRSTPTAQVKSATDRCRQARVRESTARSQAVVWFQLAKCWLTIHP